MLGNCRGGDFQTGAGRSSNCWYDHWTDPSWRWRLSRVQVLLPGKSKSGFKRILIMISIWSGIGQDCQQAWDLPLHWRSPDWRRIDWKDVVPWALRSWTRSGFGDFFQENAQRWNLRQVFTQVIYLVILGDFQWFLVIFLGQDMADASWTPGSVILTKWSCWMR